MYAQFLADYRLDQIYAALDCVYDSELAHEHLEDPDGRMACLVAGMLMDSQLCEFVQLCVNLEGDLVATELAWHHT